MTIRQLIEERAKLKAFLMVAIQYSCNGDDFDGGSIQNVADKLKLGHLSEDGTDFIIDLQTERE